MISFTPQAKYEIQKALSSFKEGSGFYFRVGMKGASCDGSLVIGLDRQNESDELHVLDDIPVIIAKEHLLHVIGTKVSYSEVQGVGTFNATIT